LISRKTVKKRYNGNWNGKSSQYKTQALTSLAW
jgi:hypothetical protein